MTRPGERISIQIAPPQTNPTKSTCCLLLAYATLAQEERATQGGLCPPALRRDPANKAKGRCSRPRFTSFCLQRASHTTAKSKQISPPNLSCTLPCIVAKRPRVTRTRSMLHPRASHLAKGRKATHATRGSCGCPSSELVSTPGSLVVRLRHVCQCQGACVSACL